MITQKELKQYVNYDPKTGEFYCIKTHGRRKFGDRIDIKHRDGYMVIYLKRKMYQAHRLAWLYMTGEHPKGEIDHINGIRDDNKFFNLEDVSKAENIRREGKWFGRPRRQSFRDQLREAEEVCRGKITHKLQ